MCVQSRGKVGERGRVDGHAGIGILRVSFGYPSGPRYGIYTAYSAAVKMLNGRAHKHMIGAHGKSYFRSVYDCERICFRKFIIRRTPGSVALTEKDIWYWV